MNFRTLTAICATLTAASVVGWYFRGSEEAIVPASDPAESHAEVDLPPASEPPPRPLPLTFAATSREVKRPPSDEFLLPSIVGVPFAMSHSVIDTCRRLPWTCTEVDVFLERMRAEVRSEPWAQDLELRIARATLTRANGRYRIRALECRRSRCAIEVASEVALYDFNEIFEADPEFDDLMWPRDAAFANELDPATGIATLVSVQTWATEAVALSDSAARR